MTADRTASASRLPTLRRRATGHLASDYSYTSIWPGRPHRKLGKIAQKRRERMWREFTSAPQAGNVRSPRTPGSCWRVAAAALPRRLPSVARPPASRPASPRQPTPTPWSAQRQLSELTVAKAGSMRGYSRDRVPALARRRRRTATSATRCCDATAATSGCAAATWSAASWFSVYDERTVDRPVRGGHRPHGAAGQRVALRRVRRGPTSGASDFANDLDPAAAHRGLPHRRTGQRATRTRRSGSRRTARLVPSTRRTGSR